MFLHKVCISQNMSGMKYTYPTMINRWRKTNYIEDPKIAKGRYDTKAYQKVKQAIERSEEPNE